MKYFEKTGGAEAKEMARIVAAIAKKKKKVSQLAEGTVKVIPQDNKAIARMKTQEAFLPSVTKPRLEDMATVRRVITRKK